MRSISINQLAVLLVEPSSTQHRIIAGHLEQLGVPALDWVQTAADALARMDEVEPDLVISAMHLPDMTGTELVQKLRSSDKLQHIPFMLISSETDVRYLIPLRQAGVIAILPKPYELEQLRRALYTTVDFLEPDVDELQDYAIGELRVLVVDDSLTSRHHIKRILNRMGVNNVVEAENGMQGAELIEKEFFDLVVTDYNMPEMDGKEFTQYIRQRSRQAGIPILMITSESDTQRLASVQQSGISALCDKPFEPETIKRILKTAVLGAET